MSSGDPPTTDPDDLIDLIDRVLDGTAEPSQRRRLEALLCASAEARRVYLRHALLDAQLRLSECALLAAAARDDVVSFLPPEVAGATAGTVPPAWGALLLRWAALAALVLLGLGLAFYRRAGRGPEGRVDVPPATADGRAGAPYYDHRAIPMARVAMIRDVEPDRPARGGDAGRPVSPSTLRLDRGARRLAFLGGADVRLQGPALFGLESRDGGVLYQGRVLARVAKPGTAFVVQTPGVRVVDLGTEFQVEVDDRGQTEIRVIEGAVEVQTQVRLPRFYWSFDGPPGSMRDLVGGATIRPGPGLHRVEGIIGAGALEFDDSGGAYAEVVGGLGDQVGKGGFAVTHGITLEALIVPRWSGRALDYDEIFRKEDGDCRILLSFQNDGYAYDVPDVAPGPCLSFGLHLEGQGYSELDMPLDGLDGRPTLGDLRDGRPHHIAAVYDSFTGRKALYIDGRLCFAHTFPAGSLILSGGPTPTLIGNHCRRNEAFDGIIDEVAFYDFALTAGEVAAHHARSLRGAHYFDASDRELRGSRWRTYDRVTEGHTIRLDQVALTQEPSVGGPREGRP